MKRTGRCPKCDSTNVAADAKAVDVGDYNAELDMQVATFRNPSALLFKGQQQSTLSAWVCLECGFVELYADEPASLRM